MRKKQIFLNFISIAFLLVTGCAAKQHAQNLSKETLIQVIEYDETIHQLKRILETNYSVRRKDLEERLIQASSDAQAAEIDRIAVEAVDKVVLDGFSVSGIRRFLSDALHARQTQEAKLQAARASFDAKHIAILEKTKVNQEQLKSIKLALENLQTPASIEEEIKSLVPLFEAISEAQSNNLLE